MSKPTIVIVPNAWHQQDSYEPFIHTLERAGYPWRCISLPSFNPSHPKFPQSSNCKWDTEEIGFDTMLDNMRGGGRDIVLLMHSYGSMPGLAASRGNSKTQRVREGKMGGVIGLVCVSGIVVPEGTTYWASTPEGRCPGWIQHNKPEVGLNLPYDSGRMFLNDVFWLERMFSEYLDTLGPHANAALCSPQPPLPWTLKDNAGPNDVSPYKDRLGYIVTTQNLVVSEMAQRGMMTASGQTWRVAKRECGDAAPFLHKAHETVKLLGEMIEAFQEVVTAELAESAPRGGKGNV